MVDGIGPGAWANRPDFPDLTLDDQPRIVPLRAAPGFSVASQDPDPRGMTVVGADGQAGGTVTELWVDRSEAMFRYLELSVPVATGTRTVLLPINYARITRKQVLVQSIMGNQFALVPGLRSPDVITSLEEDKICAYYGAGILYAEPSRQEPLL
jgi:photosynthetic reaction center H subunit